MNPKPLLALNHFTVPCSFNCVSLFYLSYLVLLPTASSQKKTARVGARFLQAILKVSQSNKRSMILARFCLPVNQFLFCVVGQFEFP